MNNINHEIYMSQFALRQDLQTIFGCSDKEHGQFGQGKNKKQNLFGAV